MGQKQSPNEVLWDKNSLQAVLWDKNSLQTKRTANWNAVLKYVGRNLVTAPVVLISLILILVIYKKKSHVITANFREARKNEHHGHGDAPGELALWTLLISGIRLPTCSAFQAAAARELLRSTSATSTHCAAV